VISEPTIALEVDTFSLDEWDSVIGRFRDSNVFQTWQYGRCRWGERDLSHAVLTVGGEPVAAAQVRMWNRVSPLRFAYVANGPVWRNRTGHDIGVLDLMVKALVREYVEKRGYTLRLVPFVHDGDPQADEVRSVLLTNQFANTRQTGRTLLLDISVPEDVLRANLRGKWRQYLGHAERAGLTVRCEKSDELLAGSLAVYRDMHERKRFTEQTPVDRFLPMQALLPEPFKFAVITVEANGTPHACLVGSAIGDTAFPVLAATASSGLKSKASYLAHWEMLKLYHRDGIRWLDLRGIDPTGNPGGYVFKTGIAGAKGIEVSYLGEYVRYPGALSSVLMQAAEKVMHRYPSLVSKVKSVVN
jgi:hypothetical protein